MKSDFGMPHMGTADDTTTPGQLDVEDRRMNHSGISAVIPDPSLRFGFFGRWEIEA